MPDHTKLIAKIKASLCPNKLEQEIIVALQAVPQWQPIETAPTDNKRPLYLARFDDEGDLMELDYDGIWEYWEESYEMAHINGWCWMSAGGIHNPTHWAYQDGPPPPC